MKVPVQSGFELFVVEGGGVGTVQPLRYKHVTIGRFEPNDDINEGVVTFPDSTVSRVHAVLEWDERRGRYVLDHRSRTNATVVNGTETTRHVLQPGDHIKMGSLVLELRRCDTTSPSETPEGPPAERSVLVLSGPDKGKICPLTHPRMALHVPEDAAHDRPWVIVSGVLEFSIEFIQQDGALYIECMERPGVIRQWPGLVYDRLAGTRDRIEMREGSVLMCGEVGLLPTDTARARDLQPKVLGGEPLGDFLADTVTPGKPPYWPGTSPYILRVLSGPDRGSTLWIDPEGLRGPILVGRAGNAGLHVEIPDKEAAEFTIAFGEEGIRICNVDDKVTFNHNWEILRSNDECELVSGDRITLGRTMLSFEHVAMQARLESFALFYGSNEMPLVRAINYIGYRPENELRIDDRRLGPRHGSIGIRDGGQFFYRHLNAEAQVKIGDQALEYGQEHALEPGDCIKLTEGIEVRLAERISTHRPSDPVLIGPTQKQLEADMARRNASASASPE